MASLKRRWTCDSSSTWEQGPRPKKTVVSPSSRVTTIARNSDVRMDMTEEGTARHGKVEIDQRCIHKRSTICSLSRWECCACIDLRPTASYYPVYADGAGQSLSTRRWRNYCPGCKGNVEDSRVHAVTAAYDHE
ncbi:hypothetical protein BU24DRAFT_419975 [Aaosphaeria arxii CBS 175.79]|uniref:Uncharacterized protein n=1 Tax=Aaosphaeria arxii CBS 175.79 TaxID=1450172 RepID=A0A6A5XU88_9PLEO|nr:uncharacterized protein BU24DRAFT_419975 [Aaosphaeria arxii CBS 175.79]KAF2016925.1 hypothetical protein BU24DRAFT_419975 [Aaosphaeria arxii CBS 175.79]